jgi:hypothetical protein
MTLRLDEKQLASAKTKERIPEESGEEKVFVREDVKPEEKKFETFEPVEESE